MTIWRLISFHEEVLKQQTTQSFIDNKRIAIGWGNTGDLGQYNSAGSIGEEIRKVYPDLSNSNIGGPSLWNMYNTVAIGDLVIIDAGKHWAKVVEITGEYEWNDAQPNVANFSDYFHQRTVKLRHDIDASQLLKITGTKEVPGQNQRQVLIAYGSFIREIRRV